MSSKSADERKAQRMLTKKLGEVEAGINPDVRSLRYEDLRRSYLLARMAGKNRGLPRNPDGTLRLDDDGLPIVNAVTRLDEFFDGMRARSIDEDALHEFVARQQAEGYRPATINRSLAALKAMLRIAHGKGQLHRVPKFAMLAENNTRSGFFSVADYRALLAALPAHLKAVLAVGFWTGVRIGEICSLRWSQIDFLGNVIRLREGETKNNEARVVPMPTELRALLLAHRAACPKKDCEWVCYREDGERLTEFPARVWKRATKQAALEGRLFHDLRRSAVRNLTRAGVSQKVAMDISGHKTASIFSRYNITDEKDFAEAARKLENFIASEVGANSGQNQTVPEDQSPADKPQVQ
jgi:integrase